MAIGLFGTTNQSAIIHSGSLDNSSFAQSTVVGWFRLTDTLVQGGRLWSKESGSILRGKNIAMANAAGAIRVQHRRNTSNTVYSSSVAVFNDTEWKYLAILCNHSGSAGNIFQIYIGNQSAPVTQSSWFSTTDGTGAFSPDLAADYIMIFNNGIRSQNSRGNLACQWVQYYNRGLTLAELRSLQFSPRPLDSGCRSFLWFEQEARELSGRHSDVTVLSGSSLVRINGPIASSF